MQHCASRCGALVRHAGRPRAARFALLDPAPGTAPADVAGVRAVIDSPFAALYYPWIVARDPATGAEVMTPPSGAVAGIYARVDASRGVHKAPANESVRSAVRFERDLTARDNELLNPAGVNALRSFVGRGNLVWGARTLSSDPEWKYVNVRRHLTYLEHSIARGLAWAVFEPNDEPLWIAVRHHAGLFLHQEWQNGALMGDRPDAAYFVRCDRTTMTPDDILHRRLVCQVGVAPLKPAEFVVFRIDLSTS